MASFGSRKTLVLIGAGSAVFTRGLLADLISATDLGSWTIRLVDVDASALDVAMRLATRMVQSQGRDRDILVEGSTEVVTALPGADFVVSCIGVGGRPAWEADWEVAQRYGILQPVGDSVMPGGIARAMRTIPVLVEVAEHVRRLAPDAFFFNYSNPMTANCRAITAHVGVDAVGLCHGVFHTQHQLARLIGKPFEETSTLYCGVNHLTFIYDFRWRGADAWPLVRETLAKDAAQPADPGLLGDIWADGSEPSHNPFSWELFERLGAYPAPGDRHTTEFFPERFGRGEYYGKTLGVDAFSLKEIIQHGEDRYNLMKREASGQAAPDPAIFHRSSGEQEQLIAILRAIVTDERSIVSANVPNAGIAPTLPFGAVVEVPAVVTALGLRPMTVPDFPATLCGIITRRLAAIDTTIEAALTGSRSLFAEAILLDGAVADDSIARVMVEDFIASQRPHLPRFS